MNRKEVTQKIIKEAKRRGFVPGIEYISDFAGFERSINIVKEVRSYGSGRITLDGGTGTFYLFSEGDDPQWAKIVGGDKNKSILKKHSRVIVEVIKDVNIYI